MRYDPHTNLTPSGINVYSSIKRVDIAEETMGESPWCSECGDMLPEHYEEYEANWLHYTGREPLVEICECASHVGLASHVAYVRGVLGLLWHWKLAIAASLVFWGLIAWWVWA